jgi:uracil phosphoribosyltransferase
MVKVLQLENSLANEFLAELRDLHVQQDSMRFRNNLERIGKIFAYEISKTLTYELQEVKSPLGVSVCNRLKVQPILCTILRAGLPFYQGFLDFFDHASSAFISAYRKYEKDGSFDIQMDYITAPDLTNKFLIVADPMLASGNSMAISIKELIMRFGQPSQIHIAVVISSREGLEFLKQSLPVGIKTTIWTVAIDQEMTAQSYIVPGLGDAGDLAFGSKGGDD